MAQYEILNAELKLQEDLKSRDNRQKLLFKWASEAFGISEAKHPIQRALRLFEETTEACQACECNKDQLHKLLDYVYSRSTGDIHQELGGIGVTLLLLANATGLSADQEEFREILRIKEKDPKIFQQRNLEKNQAGFKAKGI